MAASLAGLGLLLAGATALAQPPDPVPAASALEAEPVEILRFSKQPDPTILSYSKEPEPAAPLPNGMSALPRVTGPAHAPLLNFEKRANIPARPVQADPHRPQLPAFPDIQRTVMQAKEDKRETARAPNEPEEQETIQLEPPGREALFGHLESEAALFERMRQRAREKQIPERIEFPAEPVVSTDVFTGRCFPPATEVVEPSYVCYGRLYFEQKNYERYGWDFGILTPVLSAATFFGDVVAWPYNIAKAPCRHYDSNAGLCLPGDAVPYMLYPLERSGTGTLAEAGTILLAFVMFP